MATAKDDPMDDLPAAVAQFEEDVARIDVWVNGDELAEYLTETGVAVPSISKVIASVDAMIAPDVAAITAGATTATNAATAAKTSETNAAASAGAAASDAELAEGYSTTTAGDAITAGDAATRAEAAESAAGAARDSAAAASSAAQQSEQTASTAATNAGASQSAAAASATAAKTSETNAGASAGAASSSQGAAAASAVAAGSSQTAAKTSETNSAASAGAAKTSELNAAASAASVDPASFLKLTGGTMKGALNMGLSGGFSQPIIFGDGGGPVLQYNSDAKQLYVNNAANSASTLTIKDNGSITALGGYTSAGNDQMGVFHSTGPIGGSFVDWNSNNQRSFALQVDAQDASAAYGGIRWTRWGGRHIAAIDAYEGGSAGAPACIMFQLSGYLNAWNFGGTDIVRGAGGYVLGTWNHAAVMKQYVDRIEALEKSLQAVLSRLAELESRQ